jgi:hypothetical protein
MPPPRAEKQPGDTIRTGLPSGKYSRTTKAVPAATTATFLPRLDDGLARRHPVGTQSVAHRIPYQSARKSPKRIPENGGKTGNPSEFMEITESHK